MRTLWQLPWRLVRGVVNLVLFIVGTVTYVAVVSVVRLVRGERGVDAMFADEDADHHYRR